MFILLFLVVEFSFIKRGDHGKTKAGTNRWEVYYQNYQSAKKARKSDSDYSSVPDQERQRAIAKYQESLKQQKSQWEKIEHGKHKEEDELESLGIQELDRLIIGLEPGTLTILAARPSMGKSAIALYLALQQIIQHKLPVAIFSLEMSKKQMEYRLWSLMSRFDCFQHLDLTTINCDRIRKHRAGYLL